MIIYNNLLYLWSKILMVADSCLEAELFVAVCRLYGWFLSHKDYQSGGIAGTCWDQPM